MLADGGVDALDPQRAEIALLRAAVAIGVLPGLLDGLAGDADGVLAAAVKAFCLLQDGLMTGVRRLRRVSHVTFLNLQAQAL